MSKENCKKKESCCNSKKRSKPGDIKGKINISDKRERKDGPGGN